MPNRSADSLFQLVKSLEKSEKRNFKLYVKRNSAADDLKITTLFDALDKMNDYDEAQLLKKNKSIKKQQLSNIKAHLYRQILASLRLIKDENNIDIQLHEQMDHARILFNKGLYIQSLRILEKLKDSARHHNQFTHLQQALFFEKKIEGLFITRSMQDKAEKLSLESDQVNQQLVSVNLLSNLSLQLYSWYIKNGHARNQKDVTAVKQFLEKNLSDLELPTGFYERLYLYQCYCWAAFIQQNFLQYYRYSKKWVDLFEEQPFMYEVETAHYIKGMHNLMGAHFGLSNTKKLQEAIENLSLFANRKVVKGNDINRVLVFVYLTTAKINRHFIEGSFSEGLKLVPSIEENLEQFATVLDRHRILIFYYKIACLYFGTGKNEKAIDYLNKIINWKVDLRTDLQCYARLLHLIAHYELGNFGLLEYLTKSVYRFMAKMESLSAVEEEIFHFLRHSFHVGAHALRPEFEKLLEKLKKYEHNHFETRAFSYLDVISWLESKIYNMPVQDVIKMKFLKGKKIDR
jgi:hypothetical protein